MSLADRLCDPDRSPERLADLVEAARRRGDDYRAGVHSDALDVALDRCHPDEPDRARADRLEGELDAARRRAAARGATP